MTANEIKTALERGFNPAVQVPRMDKPGRFECFGIAEYVTADGWVGIRQPQHGNRLDEYPVARVEFDPT